jgi:hypothetical protein
VEGAALAALLLGVAGCLAPKTWFRRRSASTTELVVTVTAAARPPAPGYAAAMALVNAPPAFAVEWPVKDGEQSDDPPAAASSCCCAVCLEDVRGGETVRQVPACRHVFHVECIDMWLHSHRTCRCMILVASPDKATADQSSAEQLPPV